MSSVLCTWVLHLEHLGKLGLLPWLWPKRPPGANARAEGHRERGHATASPQRDPSGKTYPPPQ